MTETITQEVWDFKIVVEKDDGIGCKRIKGIKKYHISKKGTARLNKWLGFYKRVWGSKPILRKKFDVKVERNIK